MPISLALHCRTQIPPSTTSAQEPLSALNIFNTIENIQRPMCGALAFVAMTWMFVWVLRAKWSEKWNVAEFVMVLSLCFLVLGAVLGVLLGPQLAGVEVVSPENAGRLGESHPGAMVAGYVVLSGLALIEWLTPGRRPALLRHSKSGTIQMFLHFLASLLLAIGIISEMTLLQPIFTPLLGAALLYGIWKFWTAEPASADAAAEFVPLD